MGEAPQTAPPWLRSRVRVKMHHCSPFPRGLRARFSAGLWRAEPSTGPQELGGHWATTRPLSPAAASSSTSQRRARPRQGDSHRPGGEQKERPGAGRENKLTEDLATHLVFLPLELFLQVEFLSLQITDGLPQLLGLVPVGRAGWWQRQEGMWLTGSSSQGTGQ